MLDIHELRRERFLDSGEGEVPGTFSPLLRPRSCGRFEGILRGGVVAAVVGGDVTGAGCCVGEVGW